MSFPVHRPRRLRENPWIREMVKETSLSPSDFIYPTFVIPGNNIKEEIRSMPDCFRYSVDRLLEMADEALSAGVRAVILFGVPETKDEVATGAWSSNGIVQRALRNLKEKRPELILVADVCLCEYMSHGHCGIVKDGHIINDETLPILQKTALSLVSAGADVIAPSDMMDGRVKAIREALDSAGYTNTPILSYSAKFASAFYGPFREAAESAPKFGDRRSYQMDPPNFREAMKEIALDIEEGADIVMVKPALPYLDVIRGARERWDVPIAAFQVSGEYSMIKAAGLNGWIDEEKIMEESLVSIKRAGADIILTYFAIRMGRKLLKSS